MAPKPPYERVPSSVGMGVRLRLALNLCMRIKKGGTCVLALVCKSFSAMPLAENMLVLLRDSARVMLFGFLASDLLVEVSRYKR